MRVETSGDNMQRFIGVQVPDVMLGDMLQAIRIKQPGGV